MTSNPASFRLRDAVPSSATPRVVDVEQHSLATSVALHLLPGALLAALFYLTGPAFVSRGYPAIMAGAVCAAVVIVGGELAWLLREGHRRTGSWSVRPALPFRPAPFTWRRGLLTLGLFAWAVAAAIIMSSVTGSIKDELFGWMPGWALDPLPTSFIETGGTTAKVVTALAFLAILGVLAPFVEELYFRGYLLPRIGRFGSWAPLMNVSLFAAYHLWKPWDLVSLIVILAPTVYAVWRLQDIRISIAVHLGLNVGVAWALGVGPRLLLS